MPIRIARHLLFAGSTRLAQGDLDDARRLLAESIAILRDIAQHDDLSWSLAILSSAHTEAGASAAARETLAEALRWTEELRTFGAVMHALPAAAFFLARTGHAERALAVWELASQYPFVAHSKWFTDVVGRHIEAGAATLTAEAAEAARERGERLDVWEAVEELLAEFGDDTVPQRG